MSDSSWLIDDRYCINIITSLIDTCCKCNMRKYGKWAWLELKSFGHNVEQDEYSERLHNWYETCAKSSNVTWRYSIRGKVSHCIMNAKSDIFFNERRKRTVLGNVRSWQLLVTYSFKPSDNKEYSLSRTENNAHISLLAKKWSFKTKNLWKLILQKEKKFYRIQMEL
jgi:hypothetical protein